MKKLLLLPMLLVLAGTAQAQSYEKLEPAEYYTTGKVPLFKSPTDTTKASFHLLPKETAQVVGRLAPTFAVVKREGFLYYVPEHYLLGFSADPAKMAALLASAAPKTEEYCVVHSVWQGTRCNLRVDYGQRRRLNNVQEKDQYGNVLLFDSPVDALNFMNNQGWELVTAYPGQTFIAAGLMQVPAVFYVMKRRVKA